MGGADGADFVQCVGRAALRPSLMDERLMEARRPSVSPCLFFLFLPGLVAFDGTPLHELLPNVGVIGHDW